MSVERILTALNVPGDQWPPDHYLLLGLRPGPVEAARVEAHALDRMERLRRYQLAHPEAVTDAMNRLAQALVCLTDPLLKRDYDAGLGIVAPPIPLASVVAIVSPNIPNAAVTPEPAVGPLQPLSSDESPRAAARRRAVLRQLKREWIAIGVCLSDADQPFASRTEVVERIQHLRQIRQLTEKAPTDLIGAPGQPGALVISLARQPLLAMTLNNLSLTYRRGLAGDWAAARLKLANFDAQIQRSATRRPLRRVVRRLRRAVRWTFVEHLDLTLALVGLAALGMALARSRA